MLWDGYHSQKESSIMLYSSDWVTLRNDKMESYGQRILGQGRNSLNHYQLITFKDDGEGSR